MKHDNEMSRWGNEKGRRRRSGWKPSQQKESECYSYSFILSENNNRSSFFNIYIFISRALPRLLLLLLLLLLPRHQPPPPRPQIHPPQLPTIHQRLPKHRKTVHCQLIALQNRLHQQRRRPLPPLPPPLPPCLLPHLPKRQLGVKKPESLRLEKCF